MEIWKPVKSLMKKNGVIHYPYLYEVSSLGRIRTKKQRYGRPRKDTGKRVVLNTYRYLTGRTDHLGYMQVDLFDYNSTRMKFRLHQIVLQTFRGHPKPRQVTCHGNDIKSDNRISNLRYASQKTNMKDKAKNKSSQPR